MSVILMYCGVYILVALVGVVCFVILVWAQIMFNVQYIAKLVIDLIIIVIIIMLMIMLLLLYPYTRVCIFDYIKNEISAIASINKQFKVMRSNKIVLIYIILSLVFTFGIGISETILISMNPLFRYILSVITPIANFINILILHFIFTQMEAKNDIKQKELNVCD